MEFQSDNLQRWWIILIKLRHIIIQRSEYISASSTNIMYLPSSKVLFSAFFWPIPPKSVCFQKNLSTYRYKMECFFMFIYDPILKDSRWSNWRSLFLLHPQKMLGKWETPSIFRVTLGGWRFVEPLGVCFFRTVQSPGITDGGRISMLHVLRVGIARKFAGPQNDSTGGQAEKKSETVAASEIWRTPINMATLPKTNSSHLKHCGWFRWVSLQDGLLAAGKIHETSHGLESFRRLAGFSSINRQKKKRWRLLTLDFGVQRGSFNHEDLSENCYVVTGQWKQSFTKSACHLWSSFTSSNLFSKCSQSNTSASPVASMHLSGTFLSKSKKINATEVVSQHTASPASKDHASSMHLPNWAFRTLYHQGAWS